MKIVSSVFFVIVAIGLLVFLGWLGYSVYQQRQAPVLENTMEPLFATRTPKPNEPTKLTISTTSIVPSVLITEASPAVETKEVPTLENVAKVPTVAVSGASGNSCLETGTWNILVIGSDARDTFGPKGADLTRVLHLDFGQGAISTFAFSRDLWVDTSAMGFVSPSVDATKLGNVFYEGRIRSLNFVEKDITIDATRAMAWMVSTNFGINFDHYITLDLSNLPELIDGAGGLTVNVPEKITDPSTGIIIGAGQQVLSGSQVVAFSRAIPDSDFERIKRNDLLLIAIKQKLMQPEMIVKIPDLYNQYNQPIITDLSLEQITQIACLLAKTSEDKIVQDSILPGSTQPGPVGSLLWDKDVVSGMLRNLGIIP